VLNFDKIFGGISTASGAVAMVAVLGIGFALFLAFKNNMFSSNDDGLAQIFRDMVASVNANTNAVRTQSDQFVESNKVITKMAGHVEGIEKYAEKAFEEIIRGAKK
jgi:hypothetical protein